MKNKIAKISIACLVLIFINGCVSETYAPFQEDCTSPGLTFTKTIAQIYSIAINPSGTPANSPTYTANDIIEGYVVSSDEGGNFYQSIYVQPLDKSKGFNISVDIKSAYLRKFQPGKKVYLKLKGLGYANPTNFASGLIFGAPPTDKYAVDRLENYKNNLIPSCDVVSEELLVNKITLAQATSDIYLNTLVEIDNVQFDGATAGGTFDPILTDTSDGNTYITDGVNPKLLVRTSRFANFSGFVTPKLSGKIRGVLTKYSGTYQLVLRTERDVNMKNPRTGEILNESFTTGFPDWYTFSVTGAQTWSLLTSFGNPGSCVKMSGYAGTNNVNEDWLISPSQDLSTISSGTLSFDNAYKFNGNPIEVLISRDYSGTGNPNSATWTNLSTGITLSTGNYVWIGSGAININAFTGTGNNSVYIAFKYTSTSSAGSTWEIDNVKIFGL
jgi:hypothetical protein